MENPLHLFIYENYLFHSLIVENLSLYKIMHVQQCFCDAGTLQLLVKKEKKCMDAGINHLYCHEINIKYNFLNRYKQFVFIVRR